MTARAAALSEAARLATLAPSVHNTQPWRFTIDDAAIELHADRSRQLPVLDPDGRELLISCGAALFTVQVALAAAGYGSVVDQTIGSGDRLARIHAVAGTASPALAALAPQIERRHTNRRRFDITTVPDDLIEALSVAAHSRDSRLLPIRRREDRLRIGRLSQQADERQQLDPAYLAELRAWTTHDPRRGDGIPAAAVPHIDADRPRADLLPVRDFDSHGLGQLPADTGINVDQCLLLLGTAEDTPSAWLAAGEALQYVLLEITRHGYVASPMTQVVEDPPARAELVRQLRLSLVPQLLLRVGRAAPVPGSARRPLAGVVARGDE